MTWRIAGTPLAISVTRPSWTLSVLTSTHSIASNEVISLCDCLLFPISLTTMHAAVFLERLESYPALPLDHLLFLDTLYGFSQTTNSEIRMPFYLVVLKDPTSPIAKLFVQPVLDWIIGKGTGIIQGRMKFCRPLFRAANKVDREATLTAYYSARTLFHPIARKLIEQVCRSYLPIGSVMS